MRKTEVQKVLKGKKKKVAEQVAVKLTLITIYVEHPLITVAVELPLIRGPVETASQHSDCWNYDHSGCSTMVALIKVTVELPLITLDVEGTTLD